MLKPPSASIKGVNSFPDYPGMSTVGPLEKKRQKTGVNHRPYLPASTPPLPTVHTNPSTTRPILLPAA